ncbi:nicotinamidase [Schizosaccharomyces japonicus yFS275]|uniref:nicotinamidase n=1 Tax=Schizosaccharomyces japonicus (strain yFS275 / FY16936) TaxID=402676 RepID=B6K6W7_SCHJY|nr:nicotinamidase [Schizosaccharomyces japonicus yFS275]EEB09271.1 nicotinamidase [Schizosaccharomyces japonicus yFS275]
MTTKTALIIVDVQNDFVLDDAPLKVNGVADIIPNINSLYKAHHWDFIVATKDFHPANHVSFAATHGPSYKPFTSSITVEAYGLKYEQRLWPVHSVSNTPGSEFYEGLDTSAIQDVVYKGTDPKVDSYSGFFDAAGKSTGLREKLDSKGITDVVVVGIAGDYCVRATATDSQKFFKTTVLTDCIKSLTEESEKKTIAELKLLGIKFITSDQLTN